MDDCVITEEDDSRETLLGGRVHSLDFGYTECTTEISKRNVQESGLRENV